MLFLVLALVASAAAQRDPRCAQYARGAEAITLAHNSDCTKYLVCDVAGRALEMKCPPGLYFSAEEGVCSFDQSDCTGSPIAVNPPKPIINNNNNNYNVVNPPKPVINNQNNQVNVIAPDQPISYALCQNQPNGMTLPVVGDCFSYTVCIQNQAIVLPCQDGLAYDHLNKKCDFIEGTTCATPRLPEPVEPVEVPRTNEVHILPILPIEEPRKPSWNAPSMPAMPVVPILPPRMPVVVIPETPVVAEKPQLLPYNPLPVGYEDPRCNGQTDLNMPKMFPHARDCGKYLVCVGRMAIEKDCPAGQHWSAENFYCDFVQRANCRM